MIFKKACTVLSMLVILSSLVGVLPATAAAQQEEGEGPFIRQISSRITTSLSAGNQRSSVNGMQTREISAKAAQLRNALKGVVNRTLVDQSLRLAAQTDELRPPRVEGSKVASSNPGLFVSFDGLNVVDQTLGNLYSVEPPDQGLCVGNGFVLETINQVMRVYDTAGNPLTGVTTLNEFYGYPPAINFDTFEFGPSLGDPSCYFDVDTQRWFHLAWTLDVDPATGALVGSNHMDIAVSETSDPTGSWTIYRLPVQNDGTDGTPNHHCEGGPCAGDYPHIGADQYGFYITTNEFDLFGPNFQGAQIYALPKADLAASKDTVTVVQFNTKNRVPSSTGRQPAYTVWPAIAPDGIYNTEAGGTEFFMSSNAVFTDTGFSNELVIWALTNTQSLAANSPELRLRIKVIGSQVYGIPPFAEQKAGPIPLAQCINNKKLPTPFGRGCWRIFFPDGPEPAHDEVRYPLEPGFSGMQQVWYADGKLWGALGTVVRVGEQKKAGIAYFIVQPTVTSDDDNGNDHDDVQLQAEMVNQGYVAVRGNNLIFPAIAVLPNGEGVMVFTLVGQSYYPSAAYVHIDVNGTSDIHVAAEGLSPSDGFTGYKAFNYFRPRWGDYSAAVTDGSNIWIATEYIAQRCTFQEYTTGVTRNSLGDFGSCGGTRVADANWSTRISGITP